jgi:hypothetical protein
MHEMLKWYICKVDVAGPSSDQGGVTDVVLTSNGSFSKRGVRAEASIRKEVLATALAALSAGRQVNAAIEDEGPQINTLYAIQIIG